MENYDEVIEIQEQILKEGIGWTVDEKLTINQLHQKYWSEHKRELVGKAYDRLWDYCKSKNRAYLENTETKI